MLAAPHPEELILALAARGERTEAEHHTLRELITSADMGRLFETACSNQVHHVVGDGLLRSELLAPDSAWALELASNAVAKERLFEAVRTVSAALDSVGIAHALVESASVAVATAMPLRALGSGDVDIIIERGSLARALSICAGYGFVPEPRDGRTRTSRVELVHVVDDRPLRIEIGEVTFERHWTPLPFPPLEARWLSRRTRTSCGLPVLSPADLLVQVAIHTSMHSFVRAPGLRLYVDIDRVVRHGGIDWPEVVAQLVSARACNRGWLAFELATELLGTPIPMSARAELGRRTKGRVLEALMRAESVFDRGRPRLARGKALLLDVALEDEGASNWVTRNLAPSREWLEREFGDGRSQSRASLQLVRLLRATSTWQPR